MVIRGEKYLSNSSWIVPVNPPRDAFVNIYFCCSFSFNLEVAAIAKSSSRIDYFGFS